MNNTDELALLRQFEPVLRFNRGEVFLPTGIRAYLQQCSLWRYLPGFEPEKLVDEGALTPENLAAAAASGADNSRYYLQFISPLNIRELASVKIKERLEKPPNEERFVVGKGRLARVGYLSRIVDAIFTMSLFARGRVPGDTAASAKITFERMLDYGMPLMYYGRVIRENSWVVLQYWFFYPYNNWRSDFNGANDHEADWEQINLYLYESQGKLTPEWVAYAAHEYYGDDLRRRWDDPELETVGEHPVVYVGAGSHASYFRRGDYVSEYELAVFAPIIGFFERLRDFIAGTLNWKRDTGDVKPGKAGASIFHIPFVDYARGDGKSIGEGGSSGWDEPELIGKGESWVDEYRGLWGWFARDPISGEDAPAGPRFNRDGSVRRSWYDPVGWAGLDKVLPPNKELDHTLERNLELKLEIKELHKQLLKKQAALEDFSTEANAMRAHAHQQHVYLEHMTQIKVYAEEVREIRETLTEKEHLIHSLEAYALRLRLGDRGPLRAHIERAYEPETLSDVRFNRIAEIWSAISVGVFFTGFVAVMLLGKELAIYGALSLVLVLIFFEALFRGGLNRLIIRFTILMAFIAAFVLIQQFFWEILVVGLVIAGAYITLENLLELWN